jgi:molybdopterin-synthase adenylyltransferase
MNRLRIHGPQERNARLALLRGWWDQSVVHTAKVGVVGIGALGNEILKNLALLDFHSIVLIDKDTVDLSNLSRSVMFRAENKGQPKVYAAAASLVELNPNINVEPINGDVMFEVGLGRLRELDIVIAGLDSRYVRWWLNRTTRALGIPWVEGATEGPHGHAVPFLPNSGPCYECSFTDAEWTGLNRVASCQQLQLDAATEGRVATSPTMASMIAASQVHLAMEILHDRPVHGGKSLLFNLAAPDLMVSGRRENPSCSAHYTWDPIIQTGFRSESTNVADLLDLGASRVGRPATIELRWDLVWEFKCYVCQEDTAVRKPRGMVKYSEAECPLCRSERVPNLVHRLDHESHGEFRLAEVGIPEYDIIEVRGPNGIVWIELTGDRPASPQRSSGSLP